MDHFRQAHQELRNTDTLVEELGYQNMNAIVKKIVERLGEKGKVMIPPQQPTYHSPHQNALPPTLPAPSPLP